jgi:beta-lactam-binding protein with PASTA domain
MSFGRFIISKTFFKHLGIILVLTVILFFAVIKGLDVYTGNGEYILVPQLKSMDGDSLVAHSDPQFLQYILTDSIYNSKARPGGVSIQHPKPGAKVKKGRKVYLTIVTKGHEYIPMPNLVDLSIRRAVDVVRQSRLKVNQLIFVDNFAKNAVLTQLIKQDTIAPDSLILIGTAINLVVGNGHNPADVHPPFLLGKTAEEARDIILKSSLNYGGADTLENSPIEDLKVYDQSPKYDETGVFLGDAVRISLRSAVNFNFDSLIFNTLNDTITRDSLMNDSLLIDTKLQGF